MQGSTRSVAWNALVIGTILWVQSKFKFDGDGYLLASLISDYIKWYAEMLNSKIGLVYTSVDHILVELSDRSKEWSPEGQDAAAAWIQRINKANKERFQSPPNSEKDRVLGICPALLSALASCENKRWVEIGDSQLVELKAFLSKMPEREKIMDGLLPFLYNVCKNPTEPCNVRPLYIYGDPGTGKTHFVKELGRILGLPVIPLRTLVGDYQQCGEAYDMTSLRTHMNKFSSACIASDTKQFILVVDECESLLQVFSPTAMSMPLEFFLELFGSDEPLMDTCLKRSFPKYYVLVVFVANALLKSHPSRTAKYDAFMDRLVTIKFANCSSEQKHRVAVIRNQQKGGLLSDAQLWHIVHEDTRSGMRGVLAAVDMAIAATNATKALAFLTDDEAGERASCGPLEKDEKDGCSTSTGGVGGGSPKTGTGGGAPGDADTADSPTATIATAMAIT